MSDSAVGVGATEPFQGFVERALDQLSVAADNFLDVPDLLDSKPQKVHQAFDYWIADLYETTAEEYFTYCDNNDTGIDFYIEDDGAYTIYQCKCPDIATLVDLTEPPSWGEGPILDIQRGVAFLRDSESEIKKPNAAVKALRSAYQRQQEETGQAPELRAVVAVLGRLTDAAKEKYVALRRLLAKDGVVLSLIEADDIRERIAAPDSVDVSDIKFALTFREQAHDLLVGDSKFLYMVTDAICLHDAFKKYKWALFDWNVRYKLKDSPVNKRVVKTLQTPSRRGNFHHLNNGLLITCSNWSVSNHGKGPGSVTLTNPQIVNGCQTVSAIYDAYTNLDDPSDEKDFRDKVRVQVKVLKDIKPELLDQIVVTTNDQNPMRPRNLKSNRPEQKATQQAFQDFLEAPYFYQRKDGEFESLRSDPRFKTKSFETGSTKKRYRNRVVDNVQLAKAWYSLVGGASQVMRLGDDFFFDETKVPGSMSGGSAGITVYNAVFRHSPSEDGWTALAQPLTTALDAALLTEGAPHPAQYLLSLVIYEYITTKRISHQSNYKSAIKRAILQGRLDGDAKTGKLFSATQKDIGEALEADDDYHVDGHLNNIQPVLAELYGFLLMQRYGTLSPATCRRILKAVDVNAFLKADMCADVLPSAIVPGEHVLAPIYEFLRHTIVQTFLLNKAVIQNSPKPRLYFAQKENKSKLREKLLSENDRLKPLSSVDWKLPDETVLGSLPKL